MLLLSTDKIEHSVQESFHWNPSTTICASVGVDPCAVQKFRTAPESVDCVTHLHFVHRTTPALLRSSVPDDSSLRLSSKGRITSPRFCILLSRQSSYADCGSLVLQLSPSTKSKHLRLTLWYLLFVKVLLYTLYTYLRWVYFGYPLIDNRHRLRLSLQTTSSCWWSLVSYEAHLVCRGDRSSCLLLRSLVVSLFVRFVVRFLVS